MKQAIHRSTGIADAIALATAFLLVLLYAAQAHSSLQVTPIEPPARVLRLDCILPRNGAYHGAVTDLDHLDEFERLVGKKLAVIKIYQHFHNGGFYDNFARFIDERGAIEFLSLDPTIHVPSPPGDPISRDLSTCEVLSGDYDGTIRTFAQQIARWGKPILVSVAGEMNGDWAGWSGEKNCGPNCDQLCTQSDDPYGYYGCTEEQIQCVDGPERYRDMYRRVRDIFTAEGATNVVWVWVVNHQSFPESFSDKVRNVYDIYYPGDDYADVISMDGYNWGNDGPGGCPVDAGWKTFDQVFGSALISLTSSHYPTRPLMIGEFASVEGTDPISKAHWISDTFGRIQSEWPQIKAIVWFNLPATCTFAIDSSPESLRAYREAIADPHYIGQRVHCNYLPLLAGGWPRFLDDFDDDELDLSQWTIVTGTVTVEDGKLILSDAEIQSKPVFTYGVLQAKIESSDWKPHDEFTDASFGFERWYSSCHHGATFKANGHLAVLQRSNCPTLTEEYLALPEWDKAIQAASTFNLMLIWSPSGVTLRLNDGMSYHVVVTSSLVPTVPLNIRLNSYYSEPHPTETYTIDFIRAYPDP